MTAHPTKAVPGGCVIGLFGVFAWIYAALCVFAVVHASAIEDEAKRQAIVQKFVLHGVVSLGAGMALVYVGYRLAMRSDMSDPDNPDRPMIR